MMKPKTILLALLLLAAAPLTEAQNYSTAAGARLGYFNGITLKHFVSASNAIEGIASFRWSGFSLTGLYEWQKPVKGASNLDYFLGLGGHIGVWDNAHYYWKDDERYNGTFAIIGIDFIAGLEYTFPEVPFNVGIDWKPAFNLVGDTHWWGDGAALSLRYTF